MCYKVLSNAWQVFSTLYLWQDTIWSKQDVFQRLWEPEVPTSCCFFFSFGRCANMTQEEIIVRNTIKNTGNVYISCGKAESRGAEVHGYLTNQMHLVSHVQHLLKNQSQLFKTFWPASEHKLNWFFLGTKQFVLIMCILDLGLGIWKALLFWGSHSLLCLPVIVGIWKMTTLVCAEERQTLLSFMVPADGLSPLYALFNICMESHEG